MTLAPYYRLYDLPWSPTEEVEQRFRKVVRNAFIVFAIFAILIPFLPVPERATTKAPEIPDRIVKLVLEKKVVPPPPPPPKTRRRSRSRRRRSSSRSRRRRSPTRASVRRTPAC